MKSILIADDETTIRTLLTFHFERAGFQVTTAADGQEALTLATAQTFDCLLLDLMMPYLTGIELVARLRALGNVTPILILTARDDAAARLTGLDKGADDYLDKTTPMAEIVQRVQGLIRRHLDYNHGAVRSDRLTLNVKTRAVSADGADIPLTKREFDILQLLMGAQGEIVSRDRLLQTFWGLSADAVNTRTMDVLIGRLRKKLGGRYIRSKRGIGYSFDENFTD